MRRYFILGLLSAGLIVLAIVLGGAWDDLFTPPEPGPRAIMPQNATSSMAGDESDESGPSTEQKPYAMPSEPEPTEPGLAEPNASLSREVASRPAQDEPLPGPVDAQPQPVPPVPAGNRVLVFWEPFLTEPQARRFAALLSDKSGVAVRAEAERRRYRVALDFRDEADLNAKVGRIESSTTFDIRGTYFQRIYVLSEGLLSEAGTATTSREGATTRAAQISRVTGVDMHVVRTADGFALGVGYAQETDLLNAIQSIESLSSGHDPDHDPIDESVNP